MDDLNHLIPEYSGNNFIAFLDISGFKELMIDNKAYSALDCLYNSGYREIGLHNRNTNYRVDGIFISDCGILFSMGNDIHTRKYYFSALLTVIKKINESMRTNGYMTMTSIAYGEFNYQHRIMMPGVIKNPIYGNAYVTAFLDVENGIPKITPGLSRIVMSDEMRLVLGELHNVNVNQFNMIYNRGRDDKHKYYCWMRENNSEIEEFENKYNSSYKRVYTGYLESLYRTNRCT